MVGDIVVQFDIQSSRANSSRLLAVPVVLVAFEPLLLL